MGVANQELMGQKEKMLMKMNKWRKMRNQSPMMDFKALVTSH